jgi:hypothetical protein
MVLLCQGLVFENDANNSEVSVLLFGITTAIMMLASITMTSLSVLRKVFERDQDILITEQSIKSFSDEAVSELFQFYSQIQSEQDGALCIPTDGISRLTEEQQKEIQLHITPNQNQ